MGFMRVLGSILGNNAPILPVSDETNTINSGEEALEKAWSSYMNAVSVGIQLTRSVLSSSEKKVVYVYAFGALDALSQQLGVEQMDTLAIAVVSYQNHFGLSANDAAKAVRFCMEMSEDKRFFSIMCAGCQDAVDFYKGDTSVAMNLVELLDNA